MLTVILLFIAYAADNLTSINKSNEQQLKDKLTGVDGKKAVGIAKSGTGIKLTL